MSEVIDKFENDYMKALLVYDDEREVDKYVVEVSYNVSYKHPGRAGVLESGHVEAFETEKEARAYIKKLLSL